MWQKEGVMDNLHTSVKQFNPEQDLCIPFRGCCLENDLSLWKSLDGSSVSLQVSASWAGHGNFSEALGCGLEPSRQSRGT